MRRGATRRSAKCTDAELQCNIQILPRCMYKIEVQDLTPSQLFLLRHLWLEDGIPVRDVTACAQLDPTSTTWLVDQLERAKLLERRRWA